MLTPQAAEAMALGGDGCVDFPDAHRSEGLTGMERHVHTGKGTGHYMTTQAIWLHALWLKGLQVVHRADCDPLQELMGAREEVRNVARRPDTRLLINVSGARAAMAMSTWEGNVSEEATSLRGEMTHAFSRLLLPHQLGSCRGSGGRSGSTSRTSTTALPRTALALLPAARMKTFLEVTPEPLAAVAAMARGATRLMVPAGRRMWTATP